MNSSEAEHVAVVIVFQASAEILVAYQREHGLEEWPVIHDGEGDLFKAGLVRVSPFAISIDNDWLVLRNGLVNNEEHLRYLSRARQTRSGSTRIDRRPDAVELVG